MENIFADADIIHSYTRAEALEDGALVDLNKYIPVKESGFKYPIACTAAVFAVIEKAVNNKKHCNDYRGVVWDIFTMARHFARVASGTEFLFRVIITGAGRNKIHTFKMHIGPGDTAAPVMTIMLPDED